MMFGTMDAASLVATMAGVRPQPRQHGDGGQHLQRAGGRVQPVRVPGREYLAGARVGDHVGRGGHRGQRRGPAGHDDAAEAGQPRPADVAAAAAGRPGRPGWPRPEAPFRSAGRRRRAVTARPGVARTLDRAARAGSGRPGWPGWSRSQGRAGQRHGVADRGQRGVTAAAGRPCRLRRARLHPAPRSGERPATWRPPGRCPVGCEPGECRQHMRTVTDCYRILRMQLRCTAEVDERVPPGGAAVTGRRAARVSQADATGPWLRRCSRRAVILSYGAHVGVGGTYRAGLRAEGAAGLRSGP